RPLLGDLPVHEAVLAAVELLVLPEVVEDGLLVHVDGDLHAVGDPLRVAGVDRAGVRPLDAPEAARARRGQQIHLPLHVRHLDVREARARGEHAVAQAGERRVGTRVGGRRAAGAGGAARARASCAARAAGSDGAARARRAACPRGAAHAQAARAAGAGGAARARARAAATGVVLLRQT